MQKKKKDMDSAECHFNNISAILWYGKKNKNKKQQYKHKDKTKQKRKSFDKNKQTNKTNKTKQINKINHYGHVTKEHEFVLISPPPPKKTSRQPENCIKINT
jgi:hypothetical protein